MKIKGYEKVLISFFTLFLIIITIWLTVIPITKSKAFYMIEYQKNDTVNVTGYTRDELGIITDKMIAFLFNKTDDMQVLINDEIVFSNQALIHMRDVSTLYTSGQIIAWIVFILWIGMLVYIIYHFKRLRGYLLRYSLIVLMIIFVMLLVVGIIAIVDFDYAFELFHHIIFPNKQKFNDAFFGFNSNYNELPGVDNLMLVKILSIGLFMDVGKIIGLVLLIILIIWFTVCIILHKRYRRAS